MATNKIDLRELEKTVRAGSESLGWRYDFTREDMLRLIDIARAALAEARQVREDSDIRRALRKALEGVTDNG